MLISLALLIHLTDSLCLAQVLLKIASDDGRRGSRYGEISTRGSSVVETRLLGKPTSFDGVLSWRRLVAEYEPATAGRETSLLLKVLAQTFGGDVRGTLDEVEVKIRRYERTCGLSDRVKIAVVQKGIEDDASRHLFVRAARLFNLSSCARGDQKHHGP